MSETLPDGRDVARWAGALSDAEIDRLLQLLRAEIGSEEAREIEARTEDLLAAIREGTPPEDAELRAMLFAVVLALKHLHAWEITS